MGQRGPTMSLGFMGYGTLEEALAFTWLNKPDESTDDRPPLEIDEKLVGQFWHIFRPLTFQDSGEGEAKDKMTCPHCGEVIDVPEGKGPPPESPKAKIEEDLMEHGVERGQSFKERAITGNYDARLRQPERLKMFGFEMPNGDESEKFFKLFQEGDGGKKPAIIGWVDNVNPVAMLNRDSGVRIVESCGHRFQVPWCEACKYRCPPA